MNPFPRGSGAHELYERIEEEIPRLGLRPKENGASFIVSDLQRMDDRTLLGAAPADSVMAQCVRSGLLLRADLLDHSHRVSQEIPTPTGSYWHGIMHRREGDFGNSKYWFRRVGAHPVYSELADRVNALSLEQAFEIAASGRFDPDLFVDLCAARFDGPPDALADELERAQETEIDLLLEWSFRNAIRAP